MKTNIKYCTGEDVLLAWQGQEEALQRKALHEVSEGMLYDSEVVLFCEKRWPAKEEHGHRWQFLLPMGIVRTRLVNVVAREHGLPEVDIHLTWDEVAALVKKRFYALSN